MTQTIFITGASTGLGRATAKLFASKGWKVIATMRTPEKETELQIIDGITLLPLDVTNSEQIKDTVGKALAMGDVTVVFNNAGYGLAGPLEGISEAQIIRQFNTNLLGTLLVTKAFLPYFREKRAGMFITTTSIGGHVTFPLNSVYHATKWGLEGWSESMSFELSKFGITMKTIAPGGISTDFGSRSLDMGLHEAYNEITGKVMSVFSNPERRAKQSTAEQIAEVVYEAATDGKMQHRYIAGFDAKAYYAQRQQAGDDAFRKRVDVLFFGESNL